MSIKEDSFELFSELKEYREVVGTGVRKTDDTSYIVIYLKNTTKSLLGKLPKEYHGNLVKTEISGSFSI